SGSRTLYALAEHGELPAWFARVHHAYRTPANAVLFTSAVALVLGLTGSFASLAAVSAVARLVMYLAVCGATLALRGRPAAGDMAEAAFTIPGGVVVPVLGCLFTLGILAGATGPQ